MVGGNMHEDKNKICQLLLKTLQATDNLWNLEGLNYYPEKEIVIAVFENGAKKIINIAWDSGIAMIMDIIMNLGV